MESLGQLEEIEALIPHDASLIKLEVNWPESVCRLFIRIMPTDATAALIRVVEFSEISEVVIPHKNPWGSSVSINAVKQTAESCEIEMQSGDVIAITAGGFRVAYL